jgi:glutamate dehydrogenase/leucine dehydrogenase
MKRSLFEPLIKRGLTTLKVRYDYKTDKEYIYAAKEWDEDIKWSDYNKAFYSTSLLTENDIRMNNTETRAMFEEDGLTDYLEEVFELLRKGKFFGLDSYYNAQKDMRFTANLHNCTIGINNKDQALYTGGIRRHDMDEAEIEVIIDGLNLGRAQSHKNVASQIPYGGGKITVQANPVDLDDKNELGFLSYALDQVRFFTGPDMRYPIEMADAMNEFTSQITAGPKNPIGSSGPPTAIGVNAALKEAVKFKFNQDDYSGLSFAVMGLGSVGFPQAEFLIEGGAEKLIVADTYQPSVDELIAKYPKIDITAVDVSEILNVEADVLTPCAIGGFLTEEVIDSVKFKMIFGGANNQLHASNKDDEIKLAERLKARGILYQECWVQNIGGVMSGAEMYEQGQNANKDTLFPKIIEVCAAITKKNLEEAAKLDITPSENAYNSVESKIYV